MIEAPIKGYSSNAVAEVGESFISANGTTWSDITKLRGFRNTNVCIKAFTETADADEPEPTAVPTVTPTATPTVTPTPTPEPDVKADLTVSSVSVPARVSIGRKVNFGASIKNIGAAMGPNETFKVEFLLSNGDTLAGTTTLLGTVKDVSGLTAAASSTVSLSATKVTVPGTVTIL